MSASNLGNTARTLTLSSLRSPSLLKRRSFWVSLLAGGLFVGLLGYMMPARNRTGWILWAVACLLLLGGGAFLLKRNRSRGRRQSQAPEEPPAPRPRCSAEAIRVAFQQGLADLQGPAGSRHDRKWLLLLGEPGAGKTALLEAACAQQAGGLQEVVPAQENSVAPLRWWRSETSAFLDLAGDILTPQEEEGFDELLRLLAASRESAPLNGVFLVLSAPDLLRDTPGQRQARARRVQNLLQKAQSRFLTRIPVFVIVSHCDRLVGFREFFEAAPSLGGQLVGWTRSVPPSAGAAFDIAELEDWIARLATEVRRGLARLMAEQPGSHNVLAAYALPRQLEVDLKSGLLDYLGLFANRAPSVHAIPVQGVYLTCAKEGPTVVDTECARMTTQLVTEFPRGAGSGRGDGLFLRELLEEVPGHVTVGYLQPPSGVLRRVAVSGAAVGLLLIYLAAALRHLPELRKAARAQADDWGVAASGWADREWHPVIRMENPEQALYTGVEDVPLDERGAATLTETHRHLHRLAREPLPIHWSLTPASMLAPRDLLDRPSAHRVLLEASLMRPLQRAVEMKVRFDDQQSRSLAGWRVSPAHVHRREAAEHALRSTGHPPGLIGASTLPPPAAAECVQAWFAYVTHGRESLNPDLLHLLSEAFHGPDGVFWPPATGRFAP